MGKLLEPLVLVPLLGGLIFLAAGWVLYRWPPRQINWMYGYRTGSSMKNQARWDFAQRYAGRQMMLAGALILLLAVPGWFLPLEPLLAILLAVAWLLFWVVISIIRTEQALRRRFDEQGGGG